MYFIKNSQLCGWIVVFFHSFFGLYVMFNILIQEIGITYYIYSFIWVTIIYLNYYFNGCILARIEQEIFQDKTWGGPIHLLLRVVNYNASQSKETMNNVIKYFIAAPMCTIMILKYIYYKNPISIFLFCILSPLLFIHSQCNVFEYFNIYH